MNGSGLNQVTIRVSLLAASLAFYRERLGMKLAHQGRLNACLELSA